jgi:hypothetical protein
MGEDANIEFFGCRIKCKSSRLAALLNSDVNENVVVVGQRAVEVFAEAGPEMRVDDGEAEECLDALAEVISLQSGPSRG